MAVDREVSREATLPAFAISIAELELIWSKLDSLFDERGLLFISTLSIELPNETLRFQSLEDLRNHKFVVPRAKSFYLHLRFGRRSVIVSSSGTFGVPGRVAVTAETEMWCAAAQEAVLSVISQHKVWHHWVHPNLPVVLLVITLFSGTAVNSYLKAADPQYQWMLTLGYVATVMSLILLVFGRNWLLPFTTLCLTQHESFIRKHQPELTLFLALLGTVFTVLGTLKGCT
jgi:hypothetical protein